MVARIVGPFSLLLMLSVDLPAWFLISVLVGYGSLTLVVWIWTEARHSVLVLSAILASNVFVYGVVLFEIARMAADFRPVPLWVMAYLVAFYILLPATIVSGPILCSTTIWFQAVRRALNWPAIRAS